MAITVKGSDPYKLLPKTIVEPPRNRGIFSCPQTTQIYRMIPHALFALYILLPLIALAEITYRFISALLGGLDKPHDSKDQKYGTALKQLHDGTSRKLHGITETIGQLKGKKTSNPLVKTLLNQIIHTLRLLKINPSSYYRTHYKRVLRELDKGLKFFDEIWATEYELLSLDDQRLVDQCTEILDQISYVLITQINMDDYGARRFKRIYPDVSLDSITSRNFVDNLSLLSHDQYMNSHRQLRDRKPIVNGYAEKFSSQFGLWFASITGPNVPYIRSFMTTEEGQLLRWLRFGTPTNDGARDFAIYRPFVGFLRQLHREKTIDGERRRFFYINFQKTQLSGRLPTTAEPNRVRVIQEQVEAHEHLFASYPLGDGDIYKHKRDFATTDAFAFKKVVLDAMKSGRHGYTLPAYLREDGEARTAFVSDASDLLDTIHIRLLGNKEELSDIDKDNLVLMFNVLLALQIIQDNNITDINSACKDNIDRGNVFAAITEYLVMVKSHTDFSPKQLENHVLHTFLPPELAKRRGPLQHRLDLLTNFIDSMQQNRVNLTRLLTDLDYVPVALSRASDKQLLATHTAVIDESIDDDEVVPLLRV